MTEKRRAARLPVTESTLVLWTDAQGLYWQEKASITEKSSIGLRVTLRSRIAERAQVVLRSEVGSVTVSASVRHVRQKGLFFVTGLELPTPESPSRG